jgi:hypothetical protein
VSTLPWGPQTWSADECECDCSRQNFGVSVAGEFSGSPNDCGLFLLGVTDTSLTPGCDTIYNDWASYSAAMKAGVQNFIEAQFDSLGDWFFWTWKVCFSFLFPSIASEVDIGPLTRSEHRKYQETSKPPSGPINSATATGGSPPIHG